MTEPSERECRAIEGVARHCAATWTPGEGPARAVLAAQGRRVALAVATLPELPRARRDGRPARLREDRVACRFVAAIEAAVAARAPEGRVVIMTFEAPIRLANRTVAALTAILDDRLAQSRVEVEEVIDVLGNRVRFFIAGNGGAWAARAVGFVFTGEVAPRELATAMVALREVIVATAAACTAEVFPGEWWLCLMGATALADAATLRRALPRLAVPARFSSVLTAGDDGRIAILSG